ncbi:hypothetical protein HK405_004247 [Cladochytrium tenue]|nr:hypothetical protein HK405_004247 [Cladochytrium tenue]
MSKFTVETDAFVHIDEGQDRSAMKIFVPKTAKGKERAFSLVLPEKLLAWMDLQLPSASEKDALDAIKTILTMSYPLDAMDHLGMALTEIGSDDRDDGDVEDCDEDGYENERKAVNEEEFNAAVRIFELLSCLDLPGFSKDCWTSELKDYQPRLATAAAVVASEPAPSDFFYTDAAGKLTSILIDRGHMAVDTADTASPTRYYIEVKTTKAVAATEPFYVSPRQRDIMLRLHRGDGIRSDSRGATGDITGRVPSPRDVYIIARVSNILGSQPSVRLMVDPVALEDRGEVYFDQVWTAYIKT